MTPPVDPVDPTGGDPALGHGTDRDAVRATDVRGRAGGASAGAREQAGGVAGRAGGRVGGRVGDGVSDGLPGLATGIAVRAAGPASASTSAEPLSGWTWALRDSLNEAGRHLRAMPRNVEMMIFVILQPLMFVLLFRYVFGGSIQVPGSSYTQYLMPGIFAQTVVFGSAYTGIGLAEDMQKGFVDRLRTMPISRAAVLVGRTISDLVRNLVTFAVMFAVAFLVGFRFEGGLWRGVAATALLLFFSYAFSWIEVPIGLTVRSVEVANSAGFIWMFPVTFVSSAFVATQNMTPWLRRVADANPFTTVTNAARALYSGHDPGHTVWQALLWAAGLTAVFAALSVRVFARATSR